MQLCVSDWTWSHTAAGGRERTVAGLVGPVLDAVQRVPLLLVGKEPVLPLRGEPEPAQADVVAAALDEHRGELVGNDRVEERQVLLEQLLLQRDRVGADDHPLASLDDAPDRRQQIGEALADAGAGLDEQMLAALHRGLDRRGHLELLRPRLESREPPRDRPGLGKQARAVDRHRRTLSRERGGERLRYHPSPFVAAPRSRSSRSDPEPEHAS
jgi:hypothetical protein